MEIVVNDSDKIVEYWLTNAEKADETFQPVLQAEILQWKSKDYKVAIFYSGNMNLAEITKPLIGYNLDQLLASEKKENLPKGA